MDLDYRIPKIFGKDGTHKPRWQKFIDKESERMFVLLKGFGITKCKVYVWTDRHETQSYIDRYPANIRCTAFVGDFSMSYSRDIEYRFFKRNNEIESGIRDMVNKGVVTTLAGLVKKKKILL